MTDQTRKILAEAGVDLDSALERMMGNENLLLRMLFKIDQEKDYAELLDAFGEKDTDRAIRVSHGLKGVFGNLSVMPLYELFARQTALLRAGDLPAAEAMLPAAKRELDALQAALTRAKQAEAAGAE